MENYSVLDRTLGKIPKRIWAGFISGMIVGLLTHLYMFTHKLPNWDDINNFGGYGQGSNIGRWFLQYADPWGGRWSLPAVHGVLAVFFLSVAACLISEVLELKKTSSVILVSTAVLTFPSVAGTMAFMFTVHTYAMAVMFMCLSVYLIRKFRYGFIPGICLIVLGLGTYQAYVSFAIGLLLMGMLADLLRGKMDGRKTLRAGVKNAVILLVSVGLYMILCRVFYPGIAGETYGGVGQMGQIAISRVPRLIARCYKRFLEYFIYKPFGYVTPVMQWANIAVCVEIAGLYLYAVIVSQKKKDKLALVLSVLVTGAIPFALAFIYFMAPEAPFSILMTYSYVLVYALVFVLLEMGIHCFESREAHKPVISVLRKGVVLAVSLSVLVEAYTGYLVTNEAYFRMSVAYERTMTFFNRILANVENQEGFVYGDKVAILGEYHYIENPSPIEANGIEDYKFREMSGIALENGMLTSGVRDNFIRRYLGFTLPEVDNETKEALLDSKEYEQMPSYPNAGAIRKIEGIWVVKLCD